MKAWWYRAALPKAHGSDFAGFLFAEALHSPPESFGVAMTKAILETDIELAKSLLASDQSDDQVALALTRRGIHPPTAARLVDDLRNGRRVQPEMPAPEWVAGRRASRRRRDDVAERPAHKSAEAPKASRSDRGRSRRSGKEEPRSKAFVWLAGGIFACILIAGSILYINHRHNTRAEQPSANPSQTPRKADTKSSSSHPVLELQSDGLHLGGFLLTRDGAGSNVARFLGTPTRTNLVHGSSRLIYAYDQHGILVYADKGAATDSIVLDFEGMGGTNGAASPFQGALKVDNHAINGDTDTRTLTSITQLGLKDPGADGGIFGGQYNGLEVIFAYLKTPQRLSLVEITLK